MVTFTVLFTLLILLRILNPRLGSLGWRLLLIGLSFPTFTFLGGGVVWWCTFGGDSSPVFAEDLLRCTLWGGIPCGFFASLTLRRVLLTGFAWDLED